MIHTEPMTSRMETPFAVFLIGMRVNRPLHVHRWLPALMAMPRMLKELYAHPEYGLLSHETWFSRNIIVVQYWRSFEALVSYAAAKDSEHLPAWKAFNRDNSGNDAPRHMARDLRHRARRLRECLRQHARFRAWQGRQPSPGKVGSPLGPRPHALRRRRSDSP